MLQPCSDMSDMGMGPTGRGLSARRRTDNTTAWERDELEMEKKDRSLLGIVIRIIRLVVPHVALLAVFFLYLVLGAAIFTKLEGPNSDVLEYQGDIERMKQELYDMMSNMSTSGKRLPGESQVPGSTTMSAGHSRRDDENNPDARPVSKNDTDEMVDQMIETMRHTEWKMARMQAVQAGRAWSFPSAMLFSMTTITTIGYGDIVPNTAWGRTACIVYSIIGIPLALLFLADIGNILARLMLFICRHTHSKLFRCKCPIANSRLSCINCNKKESSAPTTSKRQIVSAEGDFKLQNIMSSEEMSYANPAGNDENKNGSPSDHPYMKSVSMKSATDPPTSHLHGVDGQPVATGDAGPAKQCQCNHSCDCAQKSDDYLEEVPLCLVVCILAAYICGGAAMMVASEGWDYGTAFYFMFITLTTIGFGDVLPTEHYTENSYISCIFFTLFGLAIMSMCIALVQLKIMRVYSYAKTKLGLC